MATIINCLNKFYSASGAKVSVLKTKLFRSRNSLPAKGVELSKLSGFEKVDNLDKYLGV